jgi:predicted peptidase
MVNVVTAILEKTLRDYAIDPTRVYLTGLSGGGSGCWQLVLRHPKYFAAVAPLASKGVQSAQLDKLKKIPIWAFHSDEDAGPPIRFVRDTVTAIREAGGNAHLTEIESKEHDCWTRAFNDYHLLDWLLAQRRGGPAWQWWQVGLQIGIPVAVIVAAWQMKKRRRRATE